MTPGIPDGPGKHRIFLPRTIHWGKYTRVLFLGASLNSPVIGHQREEHSHYFFLLQTATVTAPDAETASD